MYLWVTEALEKIFFDLINMFNWLSNMYHKIHIRTLLITCYILIRNKNSVNKN